MRRPWLALRVHCLFVLVAGCGFASATAAAQDWVAEAVPTTIGPESVPAQASAFAPRTAPVVSSELLARFGDRSDGLASARGYRSEIERTWFGSHETLAARATQTRIRALELGAENMEAPAIALLASAAEGGQLGNAMLAVRLAPNLPLVRMGEARAHWDDGEYSAALAAAWRALAAIPMHLEGSLWLVGSLLLIVAVVLTVGSMVFIAVAGASVLHHASHDVGDWVSSAMPGFSRAALVAALVLLPVALGEGFMGLTLGLLAMGFIYAGSSMRMAMGFAAALILLGAHPIMRLAGTALTAFDGDSLAVSIYSTVQGIESPRDIELLERAAPEDHLAALALAVHARRGGHDALAFDRYTKVLESHPRDPVALANLASLHFGAGETEAAIDAYERASGLTDSATVMFNLSQAYARAFRMEEFENAMEVAQGLDSERVAMLSSIRNPDFVVDVPISMREIRARLLLAANGDALADRWVRTLAPGVLGSHYAAMGGGFALVAIVAVFLGGRFEHSSLCGRCGRRICTRCDGTVWSSEICDPCHHLFNRPEKTNAVLREARIAEVRAREQRVAGYETLAALLIPGAGGVLARRPDLGIVGVLLFSFVVATLAWHRGVVPDPLALGAAGSLAVLIVGAAASLAYGVVVLTSVVIRRNS